MAELTTIGWVLSPIIKKIVDKAFSYSKSQYNWQQNMPKNLKKLADILTEIQTIVATAKHLQSMDANQEQLLRRLKDAIYEADDLLDEFEYQIKEAQAMEGAGIVSHGVSSSLKFAKHLIGQDKLTNRLKEILNELDSVRQSAHTFNIQVIGFEINNAIQQSNIMHDRVTSSILPTSETFGRAKEKEEVINLLLKGVDEPESSHTNVPVIAIVGHGGLGKTTLARLVYDDQRIKDQFDMMMWICMSENFDKIRFTREILECTFGSNERYKDVTNFNHLQKELQTKLQSKRFLLVLDDVWIKEDNKVGLNQVFFNQEMWEMLLAPLKEGKKGSKILVTTRLEIVASVFGATSITLKGLPDNETWSLLKKYAFGNEIPHNSSELEEIGQLNIKRLNGSPLAARVVGSMLKDRPDAKSWSEILARRVYNDIMPILQLSYQRLPDHLKNCFAYCSIFPKDWKFEPEKLILLWIAQGYVLPDGTERPPRDIGMEYFNQLLSRSLFEKVEQHYMMHDLIHDLAQYVSKDECFRIDGGKQEKILETVKHLGIVANYEDELLDILTLLKKMSNLRNLHTVMLFGHICFKHGDLLLDILKELKSLRVLDFCIWLELQIPETLCHCLHLRYLNLGPVSYGILPKSWSTLYHLQVLSARGQLPLSKSMFRLLKLGELKFLAIDRLVFKVARKGCYKIGVLKNMGMEMTVQGDLCIMNLENVIDKAEAAEADLGSKQYLDGLELHWDSSSTRINGHDTNQEVAQALKPHQNLKRLIIKGFRGRRCPNWLESKWLDNLQSLSLIDCSDLQVLPPLDHQPLLQKLLVRQCPKLMSFPRFPPTLGEIDISEAGLISELFLQPSLSSPERFHLISFGIFSHTALLHDHHLRAIDDLYIKDCKERLPGKWLLRLNALKRLRIHRCQELLMSEEEVDGGSILPSSLESLCISNCPVTERWLSRCLRGLTSLKELMVCYSPELKSLPQEDGGGVLSTSLELLDILRCPVTDLSLISHCTSLKNLGVRNCPELKLLPEEGLTTSLEEVCFYGCGVPKESVVRCLQGLPSLSKLTVDFWTHLTSLTSLHHLTVSKSCRCEQNSKMEMPQALLSLEISTCDVSDTFLSTCLQGLTSLSYLSIRACNELTSLPSAEVLHCLTALQKLDIWSCNELTSLGALHALASLKHLQVYNCRKLKSLPKEGLASSIESLDLNVCDELMSLQALHALSSLKHLEVHNCPKVKSLPKQGLPFSVVSFSLSNCHSALEQQIREKKGPDWDKVVHIA